MKCMYKMLNYGLSQTIKGKVLKGYLKVPALMLSPGLVQTSSIRVKKRVNEIYVQNVELWPFTDY